MRARASQRSLRASPSTWGRWWSTQWRDIRRRTNVAALRNLTDQDLKDVSVLLGHRRILLAAIQEIAAASSASLFLNFGAVSSDNARNRRAEGPVKPKSQNPLPCIVFADATWS
jgi:hypothetical protein